MEKDTLKTIPMEFVKERVNLLFRAVRDTEGGW
jgi:hypothetical protein